MRKNGIKIGTNRIKIGTNRIKEIEIGKNTGE